MSIRLIRQILTATLFPIYSFTTVMDYDEKEPYYTFFLKIPAGVINGE